jgi:hypothetical protein
MIESDKIRGIIENAIESAFVKFPDVGDGTTWPQLHKDRAECVTPDNNRPPCPWEVGL